MTAINLIYNNRDSRWRGNGVGMLLLLRRQWDSVYSKCLMPPLYKKRIYSIDSVESPISPKGNLYCFCGF